MVVPELGGGIWLAIGYGLFGIGIWIVGLLVVDRLIDRYADTGATGDEPETEE